MKEFKYAMGHRAGLTMTVSELRKFLAGYPEDMPVMATWEGVNTFIGPDKTEVKQFSVGGQDGCECLFFDVDQY